MLLLGTVFFGLNSTAQGCLNDIGVLPDGAWSYSGVGVSDHYVGNQNVVVEVSTDAKTQKRWVSVDSLGAEKFELTECHAAIRAGDPSVFIVHSEVLDSESDIFRVVDIHLEAMAGRPMTTGATLYSEKTFDRYSQTRVSKTAYFKPGYKVGNPPRYERNGRIKLGWEGTQPTAVYRP